MHILAFIVLFIFGSIGAAFKGDYSGIEAIGKFLLYGGIILGILYLFACIS